MDIQNVTEGPLEVMQAETRKGEGTPEVPQWA